MKKNIFDGLSEALYEGLFERLVVGLFTGLFKVVFIVLRNLIGSLCDPHAFILFTEYFHFIILVDWIS